MCLLIRRSLSPEIAENQTESHSVTGRITVQVNAFIRKERDSESLNGDIWEAPNEAEDTEPLDSDELLC